MPPLHRIDRGGLSWRPRLDQPAMWRDRVVLCSRLAGDGRHIRLSAQEILCLAAGALDVGIGLSEKRMDDLPEPGEVAVRPLAMKQRPAELDLERADAARQRGLRDIAAPRSAPETQFLAE